ncbi:hypothetical protein ACFL6Y_10420 [Elusimicrobiota bacterium]
MQLIKIGELFGSSISTYKARIIPLIIIMIIGTGFRTITNYAASSAIVGNVRVAVEEMGIAADDITTANFGEFLRYFPPESILGIVVSGSVILAAIVGIAVGIWFQGMILLTIFPYKDREAGEDGSDPRTLPEIAAESIKLWPYLALFDLIYYVGVGVGTMLLVIPGIYLAVRFSFGPLLLVIDKLKPIEAFKRSSALVKGYWWAIFGRYFLVFVLIFVGSFVLSLLGKIGAFIATVLFTPFLISYQLMLLESVKEAKEVTAPEV